MTRLEEKIDQEYQIFFLDETCKSRANIFAHSGEIEQKKNLKEELYRLAGEVEEETEELLYRQENLLESAYRFLTDERKKDPAESLKDVVEKWVRFLAAGRQSGQNPGEEK